jgi:WD40 repeat protein
MSATVDQASVLDDALSEMLVRARAQAPAPLNVACGLLGGGEAFTRAIWAATGVEHGELELEPVALGDERIGTAHSAADGVVVDRVAAAGVGPVDACEDDVAPDGWRIVLVRDVAPGAHRLASFGEGDAESRIFRELLERVCSMSPDSAAAVEDALGCATALVGELQGVRTDWQGIGPSKALADCSALPAIAALRAQLASSGGRALLDLGRALCLMDPQEIELSDEWALLAGSLSGRVYAPSDITMALQAFPGLFEIDEGRRRSIVRPSSPLAASLLLGGVPASASEHFEMYRALRDRARGALSRKDASDRFVARQLPRQATAASALHELVEDPLGVLCSDTLTLLRELEEQPAQLRRPAAKVVALSAHRLLGATDRASHLELCARRIGLYDFADRLAEQLPARRWRPLWAQSELMHTHRVAFNHRAPLLSVAAVSHPEGWAFVGSADGKVWRVTPYRHPTRLAGSDALGAEVRAIAAVRADDAYLVAVGTSSHAVGVLDGRRGDLLWLDADTHRNPLSAVAICEEDGGTLISAGVGGAIYAHPLVDGSGEARPLHEHGREIRSLKVIRIEQTDLVAFCTVDGVVGIVRIDDGRLVAGWHVGDEVLNSIDAVIDGEWLRLVAGTNNGSLLELRARKQGLTAGAVGGKLAREPWQRLGEHPLAINDVRIVEDRDDCSVLSAASDGSWKWSTPESTRQAGLGHVGPIWAIDYMTAGDRRYVITAGGEGACRLWLTDAVLNERITHAQPLAHRGPVSAIDLVTDPADEVLVVTGGSDGDVRIGAPQLAEGGELLTRHNSEISALLCAGVSGARTHVVSGSLDGTLRLTSLPEHSADKSAILGIAHEGVTALSVGPLSSNYDIVSGGRDGTITSWDLSTRTPRKTVKGCRYGGVQALCHVEDHGEWALVVGGQEGVLGLRYGADLEQRGGSSLEAGVMCLCPLPGGPRGLLAGLSDGRVAVVRELGLYGEDITYLDASENEIRGLSTLILGGRVFVACAGLDRHLRLLDIQSGEQAIDIDLDGYALALSSAGSSVGLGSTDGAVVISYPTDALRLNQ